LTVTLHILAELANNCALSKMAGLGTRKRKVVGRLQRVLLACVVLVAVGDALAREGSTQGSSGPAVAIELRTSAMPGEQRLVVSGTWPTPCVPENATLARVGQDLRIEARSNRGLCTRLPRPFHVELDPRAQLGLPLEKGVYRVSFYAANALASPMELRGFNLVNVDETTIQPEAGFWWPEHNADHQQEGAQGMAISLEAQGDVVAVSLLAYAEDGRPAWYFGTGRLEGHTGVVNLLGMRDGPGLFGGGGRMPAIEQGLDLKLEFLGGGRLTAWLGWHEGGISQPLLRLQPITFARQSLRDPTGPTLWLGEWLMLRGEPVPAPPLRLQLQENRRLDAEHFQLVDATGWTLTCHHAANLINSPPDSCQLAHASKSEQISLDTVGLTRLSGTDRNGAPVSLIRPPH
jgi:hypothetical protein